MSRIAVNGIELNVEVQGDGPPLVLLHGFTGDVATWEPFLDVWKDFTVIRVDIIGHGGSDSPPDAARYSFEHAVDDLVAVLDHLRIGRIALLGYSLGGRLAIHFALAHPERLWALVLESASPGIEADVEREARVFSDDSLADQIMRDGIEKFVDLWQSQPLFESQRHLPEDVWRQQREHRLSQSPLGLANSLRGMGAGQQENLLPRLSRLNVPTLLLAGAVDGKYVSSLRQMQAVLPDVSIDILPDSGHAAHMEAPGRFSRGVAAFLSLVLGEEKNRQHLEQEHGVREHPSSGEHEGHPSSSEP